MFDLFVLKNTDRSAPSRALLQVLYVFRQTSCSLHKANHITLPMFIGRILVKFIFTHFTVIQVQLKNQTADSHINADTKKAQ